MNMKTRNGTKLVVIVMTILFMSSCGNKYNFKSSKEALDGCQEMLAELRKTKAANVKELTKVMNNWQEIQDSCYSTFARDSSINIHSKTASLYFTVSDSIRKEIQRLAFSQERTLEDVMNIKINTATDREKIRKSPSWKKANEFFSSLNDKPLYDGVKATVGHYENLMTNTKSINSEKQLLDFMAEEDLCFRSLMVYLKQVPQSVLQDLTQKTSKIYNDMYSRVGIKKDSINDETMLYLTLRFNRRILQNAETCKTDIEKGAVLDTQAKGNYRWMLIQPFVTIDNYSFACLTDGQSKQIMELAKNLPEYLTYLDGGKSTEEQRNNLVKILSNYFLKNYLITTI